jgi:response regulator of citrate/malate metabolism
MKMKDQHEKIAGYRDLTQEEIDAMNALKDAEQKMKELLDGLPVADGNVGRWISLARTNFETGFMFAIKAVARPTNGLGVK